MIIILRYDRLFPERTENQLGEFLTEAGGVPSEGRI